MDAPCAISELMRFERITVAECHEGSQLPTAPAVYAWQLSPLSDPFVLSSADKLYETIDRLVHSPILTIDAATLAPRRGESRSVRRGFIEFDRIRFGANSPTEAERNELRELAASPAGRMQLSSYLEAASEFAPILYVGQTDNLRLRVQKHLAEGSALRTRVERCGLSIDDLSLRFINLTGMNAKSRRLIERLLTHFCLAPLTVKAG